jgi:hypothetical protein
MKNPFESILGEKKDSKSPEPKSPSFEELVAALPKGEQEELMNLKGIEEELGQESENGIEIDHANLTEIEEKNLERYYELFKKAKESFEQKKH